MSFLNPISEPVLMYSSTDANAPQIKYSARVAGDVKTVLKACLVTGYGTKQGAGWTIQNETDFTAEFVSPSVAMSDYRFGVDDNTTSSTAFYYTYQNVKTSALESTSRNPIYLNTTHPDNKWILLVTKRGILFIESFYQTLAKANVGRIVYMGQIKHSLSSDMGKNFAVFAIGYAAGANPTTKIRSSMALQLDTLTSASFAAANLNVLSTTQYIPRNSVMIEMDSPVYWQASGRLLGQQPGLILKTTNDSNNLFGVYQKTWNNRQVLYVCLADQQSSLDAIDKSAVVAMILLDNWEY